MGAATPPSCIWSYQTPVIPVRGHARERGGAILSRLSKMAVNRTNNTRAATLASYIQELLHWPHISIRTKHWLPQ